VSVRDRLERAERTELEDKLDQRVVRPGMNQAGTGSSTRERAERRASEAAEDKIVRLDPRRQGGMSEAVQYGGKVRERQQIAASKKEIAQAFQATPDAAAAAGLAMYEQERQWDRDKEKRNQDQIKKNAAAQAARARDAMLAITYTGMAATPQEIKLVNGLIRQKHPAKFGDPDTHTFMLMKLRLAMSEKD
jgi:hypothetical protein